MAVAVHTINFRGLAGAIFMSLVAATLFYVLGFATVGWSVRHNQNQGLWEACLCTDYSKTNDWFKAVQAMITIGLILLLLALLGAAVYLLIHSVSKNTTILLVVGLCFIGAICMLIGFIIYGAKATDHSWSFAMAIIGALFTLLAGCLSFWQMRKSGVM